MPPDRRSPPAPAGAATAFRPRLPTDLRRTLAPLARGRGDRTIWIGPSEVWRAARTPEGPGALHLRARPGGTIEARAWGRGAEWLVAHAPRLVGGDDRLDGFVPSHAVVRDVATRLSGLRIPRTDAVFEALFPSVLEQKVTGLEAKRSYAALLRRLGRPAPVPPGAPPLLLPPDPADVAGTPSHVFHAANVERHRSDTIRRAAGYAHRLEECVGMALPDAHRRLQTLPGVGPWTAAEVALVALGDADAVPVGDFHLKHTVSWALAGEPRGTDERMLELLEPYRPHRGRVVRLLTAAGVTAPKYGPRLSIQPRW